MKRALTVIAIVAAAAALAATAARRAKPKAGGPAPMNDTTNASGASGTTELATLGGGCFWCMEAILDELKGVRDVQSGYSGGSAEDATYEKVCTGRTGHAESVQITFDPSVISYRDLLRIFFTVHDPTTLNRQGADVGTQYRSVIFYRNEQQKRAAEDVIAEITAAHVWDHPIVTEVVPFKAFYPAEAYHQEYYEKNGGAPYCQIVIAPKVAKFREKYAARLKK
jgi:peptide-methionine (S)-S-oxide reductase